MDYKIAVVGATGKVGRTMLNIMARDSLFDVGQVHALASRKSVNKKVSFGDEELCISCLEDYDFYGTDIALFSAGSSISSQYVPIAVDSGCVVIDNTSFFRMREDVPLIIPEVNRDEIMNYRKSNIIANPNCSTIQMLLALNPLNKISKIKRIVLSTYQSVSGAGKKAMDELFNQTKGMLMNFNISNKEFTKQIAFNCIPHIDSFMDDGFTKEEWKMSVETKKILDESIEVNATCVRVPVFVSHAISVNVEFHSEILEKEAIEALNDAPGVLMLDRRENGGYATQVDAVQQDCVYVSRLRMDPTVKFGLNMWIVSDNLVKGAALNSVQIAEILAKEYF